MMHYILMADIIKSGKQKSEIIETQFKTLVSVINAKHKKKLLSPLTITLGDEFQGIANSLTDSLSIIISIEEAIIANEFSFKLRYVLYYGEIDTPINKKIAYGMLGPGLTKAREALGVLKKGKKGVYLSLNERGKEAILNNLFALFTYITSKWKASDYSLLSQFIAHSDYKEVAAELKKDVSLMWRRRKSLNIEEYNLLKNTIFLVADND